MNTFSNWQEVFQSSFINLGEQFSRTLPSVIGAILLIIIGWIIAGFVQRAINVILKKFRLDELTERMNVNSVLKNAEVNSTPSELVAVFCKWIIFLFFLVSATNLMGWEIVAVEIAALITYLPVLFSAIVLVVVGIYIASFFRSFLTNASESMNISGGRVIANLVFYFIAFVICLTAIKHAGLDVSLITSNLSMILGAVILAFAVAFLLASRNIFPNIIASMYARRSVKKGQKIRIGNISGTVIEIDRVSIMIDCGNHIVSLPASRLLNQSSPETAISSNEN